MRDVTRSTYRVLSNAQNQRAFLGTAFAISSRHLVTCNHVVKDDLEDGVFLTGSASEGLIELTDWRHFNEDGFDLSLATLPKSVPDRIEFLIPAPVARENLDVPLTLFGFGSGEEGLDEWTDQVSGADHRFGLVKLQNTVRKGVSGGPVQDRKKRTVGIVVARRTDASQKYILLFSSIFGLLEKSGVRFAEDGILAVPIGPMLRAYQIPDALVGEFAHVLNDPTSARSHVMRATEIALANNPESFNDRQVSIMPDELPQFTSPRIFWNEIFDLAGKKSRRCVASLLTADGAPDQRLMDDSSRKIIDEFWNFLKNP